MQVDSINVRMYRGGTGDFFALLFKTGDAVTFKMVIDCGCINGGKDTFKPLVNDLAELTGGEVDLLVVTHEHADHINGFERAASVFQEKEIKFKQVWFAWTESTEDSDANDYRKMNAKTKLALNNSIQRFTKLQAKGYFEKLFEDDRHSSLMMESTKLFLNGLEGIKQLNEGMPLALDGNGLPTMEDFLRKHKIIDEETNVEFLDPGELIDNLPGAEGIRFFVLGPPKAAGSLNLEERDGENFEKREKPSTRDFALTDALAPDGATVPPFESEHEWTNEDGKAPKGEMTLRASYGDKDNHWRRIDHDWLFSAGGLALRYERSINNTSLVLAIQFADSERVLLFPGDAELGKWLSWQDPVNTWSIKKDNSTKTVKADYLLENTVFYKVGHHLSQNGTAKAQGLEKMKSRDFSAMATLDFKKINTGWLNTMPNDMLGAELIRKTKGKLFFVGDRKKIVPNIRTERVSVSKSHLKTLEKVNEKFDGKVFIEVEVKG